MKRQLADLLPRSRDLLRRTQKVLAGAALAAYGMVGISAAPPSQVPSPSPASVATPTIVDRSKKAAKLVLTLPGKALNHLLLQHRSHSSHRSSQCAPRGACRREPLANDRGCWTWCPDCLTLFDDYGQPVNVIHES